MLPISRHQTQKRFWKIDFYKKKQQQLLITRKNRLFHNSYDVWTHLNWTWSNKANSIWMLRYIGPFAFCKCQDKKKATLFCT